MEIGTMMGFGTIIFLIIAIAGALNSDYNYGDSDDDEQDEYR